MLGRELCLHVSEYFIEDASLVGADVKMRGIEDRIRVVPCVRLTQHSAYHLSDLTGRRHFLVYVGKCAEGIVPPFLKAEIEYYVLVVAGDEVIVIAIAAAKQIEAG